MVAKVVRGAYFMGKRLVSHIFMYAFGKKSTSAQKQGVCTDIRNTNFVSLHKFKIDECDHLYWGQNSLPKQLPNNRVGAMGAIQNVG
jgi:hypothetical protein